MLRWFKERAGTKPEAPPPSPEIIVDERALELVALGDKMYSTEDHNGAMEAYNSALRIDGHCADAWFRKGRFFKSDDMNMQAAACFVRALELNPKIADAWCAMGEIILNFIESNSEPLFIRENLIELITESADCFDRTMKLGREMPKAREGREKCRELIKGHHYTRATPLHFSFHSGGILENAKREVVSPFLKPGDYRRRTTPTASND